MWVVYVPSDVRTTTKSPNDILSEHIAVVKRRLSVFMHLLMLSINCLLLRGYEYYSDHPVYS